MPYKKASQKQYAPARLKRKVKAKAGKEKIESQVKRVEKVFALRPVGPWSAELLTGTPTGDYLRKKHLENVKVKLKQISKAKNKKEAEKLYGEIQLTPQQRLVMLYEKSLQGPLSTEEFKEYLDLFRENFPKLYKNLYGNKTPAQVTAECLKDWKRVEGTTGRK
ncbi:MAG: hypothetical protein QXU81_00180 [Candidatus Bathyarchaeia archaeon]